MKLQGLDWVFIGAYFLLTIVIGVFAAKRSGKSFSAFFLANRSMPWWLLGISMVATTFSNETPNTVTDMVRTNGVSNNWAWWAFLLTGMSTVFIYTKLWRRSDVVTDLEFYEIRYSGKIARFLQGFRAVYLGLFFNVLIMASVTLAMIKISGVMFGVSPEITLVVILSIVLIYSVIGGFLGVLLTDLFQFGVAMLGAFYAAIYALKMPEVGGLSGLIHHPNVVSALSLFPDFSNMEMAMGVIIIPLTVQWWASWYPGSEQGGGGYVAQRMLAAKSEKDSVWSVLFFNVCHYALRPWPWILVALASMIIYPDIASLQAAFPNIDPNIVKNDLAYPAMLSLLPVGWLGVVVASMLAAYMSTMSTHLNWGSSYLVNDLYKRCFRPNASDKEQVLAGRVSILILTICAGLLSLALQSALKNFQYMILFGAGTGLLFLLRWFWWRINALSEIVSMCVSLAITIFFVVFYPQMGFPVLSDWKVLIINVTITTVVWIATAFLSKPTDKAKLIQFVQKVKPGGPGWNKVYRDAEADGIVMDSETKGWDLPMGILLTIVGCIMIWSFVLGTGYWLFNNFVPASILTVVAIVSLFGLLKGLKHMSFK